jgi:hypothetical protein
VPAAAGARIVIYGNFSDDWVAALNGQSPVWREVEAVREVVVVSGLPEDPIPMPAVPGLATIAIPLVETNYYTLPQRPLRLVPGREAVETLGDKAKFAILMRRLGLADFTPETFTDKNAARFPCVLKRTDKWAGTGVALVDSLEALEDCLLQEPWLGHPALLQALVPGRREFVTHALFDQGRLLWHCSFSYEMPTDRTIRKGAAQVPMEDVETDSQALDVIVRVARHLHYSGPLCANFKMRDGRPLLLEINPRLGGSLMRPRSQAHLARALRALVDACLARA